MTSRRTKWENQLNQVNYGINLDILCILCNFIMSILWHFVDIFTFTDTILQMVSIHENAIQCNSMVCRRPSKNVEDYMSVIVVEIDDVIAHCCYHMLRHLPYNGWDSFLLYLVDIISRNLPFLHHCGLEGHTNMA